MNALNVFNELKLREYRESNSFLGTSILAGLETREKPFIYISPNAMQAREDEKIFLSFGFKTALVDLEPDLPIYTENKTTKDCLAVALEKLARNETDVIVVSAPCLLYKTPKIGGRALNLAVGAQYKVSKLVEELAAMGYSRNETIEAQGEFAVRGDVVDFWGLGEENPTRVMFFGDEIEAIKIFNISTFLSITSIKKTVIYGINQGAEIDKKSLEVALSKISPASDNLAGIINEINAKIAYGANLGEIRWVHIFSGEIFSPLELLRAYCTSIIFCDKDKILNSLEGVVSQNKIRVESLIEGGLLLPEHEKMLANLNEVKESTEKFKTRNIEIKNGEGSLEIAALPNYHSSYSSLANEIVRQNSQFKKTVIIFAENIKGIANYLAEKGVAFNKNTLKSGEICLFSCFFPNSFELTREKIAVYSLDKAENNTAQKNVFDSAKHAFVMPRIGEIVVHKAHGLGRFIGLKNLKILGGAKDYIALEYDAGAMVYIPPEQTELLSNYNGEPARLSKIGGQDFAQAKQRVRRRLKELSFRLTELYAKRAKIKSNQYILDPKIQAEFASACGFSLTTDQQKAVADIQADMLGPRVVDRLICGDVGYGKTEVAFRAIFDAVMSGYQVIFLCPTTVLSVQHYESAKKRFEKFGVKVASFNRFTTPKEEEEILRDLKSGKIDVIIGTHKLLYLTDKNFENLGMLVLDEEQRFGVSAKEKIKNLKPNIDVLTLSATPIPRTLNMALLGIRDISVITSAPAMRLPVITYIAEYSDALLADSIRREFERGGQTLVLYNNVADMPKFAARVQKLLGAGVRVGFANGKMTDSKLEEVIASLYRHGIDVLITSTIIENGIDITSANTIFVVDADKLGTAQMHQLRGRVGRGQTQAYAYFTHQKNKILSTIAKERTAVIQNFSGSGAGLSIAMRDLNLRGGGDILGANQSGHIAEIGFDLYCQILAEVSAENRGEEIEETAQEECVIDINIDSFISEKYIASEAERMKIYVAISGIKTESDANAILTGLADLYGRVPQEVKNIVLVGYIRALAKQKSVRRIKLSLKRECRITLTNGEVIKDLPPTIGGLIGALTNLK
ncbi:MAG: transcription-repair coupling factor [Christensenellaceae bacterium]|nr:transcription-repair coupling factor [Christensenellaceae bacterium]